MVTSVTNLTRNGVSDWLIQRVSAVILAVYFIILLGFFCINDAVSYAQWLSFIKSPFMAISSVLAVFALAAHAWIGLWTISTDYIKNTGIRLGFQWFCNAILLISLVWVIQIFWF